MLGAASSSVRVGAAWPVGPDEHGRDRAPGAEARRGAEPEHQFPAHRRAHRGRRRDVGPARTAPPPARAGTAPRASRGSGAASSAGSARRSRSGRSPPAPRAARRPRESGRGGPRRRRRTSSAAVTARTSATMPARIHGSGEPSSTFPPPGLRSPTRSPAPSTPGRRRERVRARGGADAGVQPRRADRRRRVEGDPAVRRDVRLDPGVRVGVVHDELAGATVGRARGEPGRDPGGDALHPQQERHRPGELLAVALLVAEQERRERDGAGRAAPRSTR